MSHTIYAGKIAKRRNSTLQPTLTDSYDVLLKSPTSLHTPTFTISASSFDYNYLKWDDRYYFVTDVVSKNNSLWEVSAVCDVLATFKADILASTQFVSYSSVSGGIWLPDTRIPVLKSTDVNSDSSLTGILSTIGCYILTVVGQTACITYMINGEGTLSNILNEIANWRDSGMAVAFSKLQTPQSSYTAPSVQTVSSGAQLGECFNALCQQFADICVTLAGATIDIQDKLSVCMASVGDAAIDNSFIGNAYINAPQCIRSCIWVPFDSGMAPGATGVSSNIYLGTYDTHETGTPITGKPVTGANTVNIPWHYNDWRRAICEDVYLYLPLVGLIQLSGDSITHASTITIDWSATYTDGVITYKLSCGGEVIGSYGAQCSANYPLGLAQQSSAGEVFQSVAAGVEKAQATAIAGLASINPIGWTAGAAGMATNIALTAYDVANTMNSRHITSVGGIGGGAGIGLGRDCICYTVAHDTIVSPATMQATMGVPTMKPMALSGCNGYCQCANAHVAATGAEAQELDEIDAYLNSGFYIE